jgi:hypothetical protein
VEIRFSAPVRDGDGAARNVWYMDMFGSRSLIQQFRPKDCLHFTSVKTLDSAM